MGRDNILMVSDSVACPVSPKLSPLDLFETHVWLLCHVNASRHRVTAHISIWCACLASRQKGRLRCTHRIQLQPCHLMTLCVCAGKGRLGSQKSVGKFGRAAVSTVLCPPICCFATAWGGCLSCWTPCRGACNAEIMLLLSWMFGDCGHGASHNLPSDASLHDIGSTSYAPEMPSVLPRVSKYVSLGKPRLALWGETC